MRSKKILIVDDFPAFTRSVTRRLKTSGFDSINIAINSREAWTKLVESKPDVILMDIDLGERSYDGLTVLSEMRGMGFRGLGVIVSGNDSLHHLYRALGAGADDYWCKGAYLNIVLEMVELLKRPKRPLDGAWSSEDVAILGYFRTKGFTPSVRRVVVEYSRDFPKYRILGHRLGRSPKQLRKVMADVQEQLGVEGQGQLASLLTVCGIMGKRSRS
jgi:DNA-binding response OmpR family regulator